MAKVVGAIMIVATGLMRKPFTRFIHLEKKERCVFPLFASGVSTVAAIVAVVSVAVCKFQGDNTSTSRRTTVK